MSLRETDQLSFADALSFKRAGLNERLGRIAALIDWVAVDRLLEPLRPDRRGAPGYAPLLLFKAVLLAQWNGLSDEAMEEMLADRLSFQDFCGLGLADPKPDHSTLWRFREALAESGLADALFQEINRQLGGHGFFLRQGTLIDATLVAAQATAPPASPAGRLSKVKRPRAGSWAKRDRPGRHMDPQGQEPVLRLQGPCRRGSKVRPHPGPAIYRCRCQRDHRG